MKAYFFENNDIWTIIVNGKPHSIHNSHPNYSTIISSLEKDLSEKEWEKLLDIPKAINTYMGSDGIEVIGNSIFYNGNEIHNVVALKILDAMRRGLPHERLILFLNNLLANTSKKAIDRLYDFLSHHGMAISDDGCFVGYKGVNTDFSSKWKDRTTRKPFYYYVGTTVEMPRNEVDDDENNACSYGIHVGTYEYAKGFGPVVLLVKVNPKDAVTVPSEEVTKLRCCKVEVLQECERIIDSPYWDNHESYEDKEEPQPLYNNY